MASIETAAREFREMDDLASMKSPMHDLHPLSKLITVIAYIVITVSFDRYALSGIVIMVLFPIITFQVAGINVSTCFHKLSFVLPLVCAVGLFNPIFDRRPMLEIGALTVSYGWVSMLTLMLKGIFCLMASFIFVATTGIDSICAALRKIHAPRMAVTLLMLTYRYVAVMIDEVGIMNNAYKLRSNNQSGIHVSAWGSFLGQLLLRSMDKAGEIYDSMQLRGFNGNFGFAGERRAKAGDVLFVLMSICLFMACRCVNIAEILGRIL
ncbi:MAG: cobalt ECF transporter T component CbiQ [Lachnospiraceae bacterium]|nr:cobalt ECF transporter T component CbiQ [Lachnospiraceae bacterium]